MDNGAFATVDMLRLIGSMAICVGLAWAAQILGYDDGTALSRLVWVLGAAVIAGAGAGSLLTAWRLQEADVPVYNRSTR